MENINSFDFYDNIMSKIKNRHRLKNKEIKNILAELKSKFNCNFFDEESSVEKGILGDYEVVLIDNEIDFMYHENNLFFTLKGLYKYKLKNYFVIVDMGAIRFITDGADIMAPGIVDADPNIVENDYVWICDIKNKKPLSVGIALMTGEQMKNQNSGKAIKNIHYVGDNLWALIN